MVTADAAAVGPADQAFLAISPALARENHPGRILHRALAAAVDLAAADGGQAFLLDRELRHLHCEAAHPAEAPPSTPLDIDDPAVADDPLVYCLRSGRPVLIDVVQRYSGYACDRVVAWLRGFGGRPASLLAVPVRDHSGGAVGVLVLLRWTAAAEQDGLPAPFDAPTAGQVLRFSEHAATAVVAARLMVENSRLHARIQGLPPVPAPTEQDDPFAAIVGNSAAMRTTFALARRVAPTDVTVLVLGETGTGKDVFARAIHAASARAAGPLIAQNCAAIPESLLEAELFGWKKGAFSGADRDRPGLLVQAAGGTLFLDEIGDMPLGLQAKLLRVLQDRRVRPLGGREEETVDVRVIAATHRDLAERVRSGTFRADLYYRLAVFPLDVPPLRERLEDLPLLLRHFAGEVAASLGTPEPVFHAETLRLFERHPWPGNIRELRNFVERAALLGGEGEAALLKALTLEAPPPASRPPPEPAPDLGVDRLVGLSLKDAVTHFETEIIRRSLRDAGGSQRAAAQALGLPRRTLADKIRRYGLSETTEEGVASRA